MSTLTTDRFVLPFFWKSRKARGPRLPDGLRFYVVADIHGSEKALLDVFARIDADIALNSASRLVQIFLGDYVDRGPNTREVLDRLITRARSYEIVMLRGNHEEIFLSFFTDPTVLSNWRQFGALPTLLSYGLRPTLNPTFDEQQMLSRQFGELVPSEHRILLQNLPSSFSCGDYFFVHAGIRPGIPLREQREEDLLWIREDFLLHEEKFEKFVIHGHTPVKGPEIRSNRINLDTGAYITGKLSCLVLEGEGWRFI
jgi:serine/threonine protein phosphatase 1